MSHKEIMTVHVSHRGYLTCHSFPHVTTVIMLLQLTHGTFEYGRLDFAEIIEC